jgi:restriction endonuclease S subunit
MQMAFFSEIRSCGTSEIRFAREENEFHFTSTKAAGDGRYFTISEENYFTFHLKKYRIYDIITAERRWGYEKNIIYISLLDFYMFYCFLHIARRRKHERSVGERQ